MKRILPVIPDKIFPFRKLCPEGGFARIVYAGLLFLSASYLLLVMTLYNALNRTCSFPILLVLPLWIAGLAVTLKAADFLRMKFSYPAEAIAADPPVMRTIDRVLIVCFFLFAAVFLLDQPDFNNPDTVDQWNQVQTLQFRDWHPVLHTLLIRATSQITNTMTESALVQFFLLLLTFRWLLHLLYRNGVPEKWIRIILWYWVLNPVTWWLYQTILKDAVLVILALLLTGQLSLLFFSEGERLKKWSTLLILFLLLSGIFLIRHNGGMIVLPLLVLLPFIYRKYALRLIGIAVLVLGSVYLVKNVATIYLEHPGLRSSPFSEEFRTAKKETLKERRNQTCFETVGLPMSIMGGVLLLDPERLPEKAKAFMLGIEPEAVWRRYLLFGNYNTFKWKNDHSIALKKEILRMEPKEFLSLFFQTVRSAPQTSLRAAARQTEVVWAPIAEFDYELPGFPQESFTRFDRRFLINLLNSPIFAWLWSVGSCNVLFLFLAVGLIRRHGEKVLTLTLPWLCYNWGTMLLLCAQDYRFFAFNPMILLPVAAVLLRRKEENCRKEPENGTEVSAPKP